MTGYGRGEVDHAGVKFSVELNSVNRKQSDIVINLPRDFAGMETRIRQAINEKLSRGRTSVTIACQDGVNGARKLALDTNLARSYHEAMRALQRELDAPGEVLGLRGRGVTFTGQTETGTIQIIANDDAPLGQQPFLRLYGVGVLEDKPVFHGSCFLNLEIVK